jgi:hypothetical protein
MTFSAYVTFLEINERYHANGYFGRSFWMFIPYHIHFKTGHESHPKVRVLRTFVSVKEANSSHARFYPIYFKGMSGSPLRISWKAMNAFAKSFGLPVSYTRI